ncbi:hypothetical protein GCM10009593_09750 [Microlunatus antarcticus]
MDADLVALAGLGPVTDGEVGDLELGGGRTVRGFDFGLLRHESNLTVVADRTSVRPVHGVQEAAVRVGPGSRLMVARTGPGRCWGT